MNNVSRAKYANSVITLSTHTSQCPLHKAFGQAEGQKKTWEQKLRHFKDKQMSSNPTPVTNQKTRNQHCTWVLWNTRFLACRTGLLSCTLWVCSKDKKDGTCGGRGEASTAPAHKRLSKWPWTVNNPSPQPAGARPMFPHHWPLTEPLAAFSQHRHTPPGSPGQTLMCQSSTGNQMCPKMRPKMLPLQLFPCSTPAPSC